MAFRGGCLDPHEDGLRPTAAARRVGRPHSSRADGPLLHGPLPRLGQAAHVAGRSRHGADHFAQARREGRAPGPVGPAGSGVRADDTGGDRPAGPVPRPPGVPARKARAEPRGRLPVLARQQQAALPVRPRRHPRPEDGRDGASRGEPAPLEAGRRGERLLRSALPVRQRPRPLPVLPAGATEPALRALRGLSLHRDVDVGPARQRQGRLAGGEPPRPSRRLARRHSRRTRRRGDRRPGRGDPGRPGAVPGTPAVGPVVRLQCHEHPASDPATMDRPVRRLRRPHRDRLRRAAAAGDPQPERPA